MTDFKIIGIAVETTNQNNQAAQDLGKLWQRFYGEEVCKKVTDKVSEDIYVVYTDYESDYTGKYTTIIGHSVNTLEKIPDGMVGREINNKTLKKYVAVGEMPNAVVNTWQKIWADEAILNRNYHADFEIYGENAQQAPNSKVEIFIGVK